MYHTKISFEEEQVNFLNRYAEFGFKNKSSLVRSALFAYKKRLEEQMLKESAEIYAELYKKDAESQDITESALDGWPE